MHRRPSTSGRPSVGDWIATTFTLFPPPLNGAPLCPLLFPEPKQLASMLRTNRPLDHRLPFPPWPYKRLWTFIETNCTPHPLSVCSSSAKGASQWSSPTACSYICCPAMSSDPAPSHHLKWVPLRPLHLFSPSRRYSSQGDASKAALRQACHHLCPAVHGAPLEALVHEALHQVHKFIHPRFLQRYHWTPPKFCSSPWIWIEFSSSMPFYNFTPILHPNSILPLSFLHRSPPHILYSQI
jgi:hypothetical protein